MEEKYIKVYIYDADDLPKSERYYDTNIGNREYKNTPELDEYWLDNVLWYYKNII